MNVLPTHYSLIIAGPRDLNVSLEMMDLDVRAWLAEATFTPSANYHRLNIISGGARGIDSDGEAYAKAYGHRLTVVPAEWDQLGKAAGSIRNEKMAGMAESALVYLRMKGPSPGSSNMIAWMHLKAKAVKVIGVLR